ncbi:transmembrane protein 53-A-like [Anticarsia gemmatalis]|uniref:transmembrane protein 53-A-like n=1 Tax=Anticarsia gemmatalis TaxID=129554 RepID=UPI003F76D9B0
MEVCRLRTVACLTFKHGRGLINNLNSTRPHLSCAPISIVGVNRGVHTQNLTQNMQHFSNDDVKLKVDPKTMDLNRRISKPLCIMMNFMLANPKHVKKYADLYLTHGYDVIAVSCSPWQLMWPVKGSQVIADRLLRFLEVNECGSSKPLVVHGFSVGAYVWAELLVQTTKDQKRFQPVLDRIGAQVWDSGADIHEIPVGFPTAVFPKNKFLQETFRAYIKGHMRIFHNVATKHYIQATEVFHANPCKAPGLFLVSKTDPVGAEKRSRTVAASWEKRGIKCNFKCWDRSPHVQHYLRHPEEYREILYSHLKESGVLKS